MIEQAIQRFLGACKAIDAKAAAAQQSCLQDGFAMLMRGDETGRDRMVAKCKEVPEIAKKAKLEAGYRIAEEMGLDREEMAREVEKFLRVQ